MRIYPVLKVEIGGDAQSTDGSEASHMHSEDDLDLNRGYEWWILKEAKKRNPNIRTYGLPWAFPSWVSSDAKDPFVQPEKTVNYVMKWIQGARDIHGITIDYLGLWNERQPDSGRAYTKLLRKALDNAGFNKTWIVSNDGDCGAVCSDLHRDKEYNQAVDVIGLHYPSDKDFRITHKCQNLEKPIWAAEESSSYDDLNGAACWARVVASHFVLQNITANYMWNLVGSYFHGTLWYGSSMLTAVQPWSGYYDSDSMPVVWATAHYTQFTEFGWLYDRSRCREMEYGGYINTFVSPDKKHMTIVIVKISRDHAPCTRPKLWNYDTEPEAVEIDLPKDFVGKKFYGRYSNLESTPSILFEPYSVKEDGGHTVKLYVDVGDVFTLSTYGPGTKGKAKTQGASRPSKPAFPLPHKDDFSKYDCEGCYPKYLSDQNGAFEIHDGVLRQMAPKKPIFWIYIESGPVTVVGSYEWEDILIKTRFRIPSSERTKDPAACIATRTNIYWGTGVVFCVSLNDWVIHYGYPSSPASKDVVAQGSFQQALDADTWHDISLGTVGDVLGEATVNGQDVVHRNELQLRSRDSGFVALASRGWDLIEFQTIEILPIGNRWNEIQVDRVSFQMDQLSVGNCTANAIIDPRQQFELKPNWQIVHIPTGLCVDATNQQNLQMRPCRDRYEPQQFRNDYTTIRNERQAMRNQGGFLVSNKAGELAVEPHQLGHHINQWTFFPNSMQLRASMDYVADIGSPKCLTIPSNDPVLQES